MITNLTNLYSQEDFPQLDMAFTYHLGVCAVLSERSRREPDEESAYAAQAWRKFKSAADAMDTAGEAEDFQAVGVMCRETLLALTGEYATAKEWASLLAESLAEGRLRAYLKALTDKTWDLCVWLQHYADATPWDAELTIDATAHVLGAFSRAIRRHEDGAPERCVACGSYLLHDDGELAEQDGSSGYRSWKVCGGCGWESEATFEVWDDVDPRPHSN